MKKVLLVLVLLAVVMSLTSCIIVDGRPGAGMHTVDKPAGFLWGLWHGATIDFQVGRGIMVSSDRGFFTQSSPIHESNNVGWWYDFGFLIGCTLSGWVLVNFLGASLLALRKKLSALRGKFLSKKSAK
jgi:hypothetical protein